MVYAVSILALVAIFTVATITPINMGILAFAGAFVVGGWVSGIPMADIFAAFPGSTFILLAGITLLFAIAKANGTLDVVIDRCLRLVRGKRWAILWMMFGLAGLLMAFGSVIAPAMLAPVAMPLAARYKIKPFLMALMLSHGSFSCVMSPVTLYGAFVGEMTDSLGLSVNRGLLFVIPFVLNVLIAAVVFFVYGGHRSDVAMTDEGGGDHAGSGGGLYRKVMPPPPARGGTATLEKPNVDATPIELPAPPVLTPYRALTAAGIAFLAVGSVAFGIDVGVSAICISTVLLLLSPKAYPKIVDDIAWPAVFMVCGMVTYMAVLTQNGTLDYLGEAASASGAPLIAALILCYVVAIMSAFGSSIGTLGIALPIATPLLLMGDLGVVGFAAVLGFCATVVDVSPFTTNSAVIIAEADVQDKLRFQRKFLAYCGLVVAVAPLLAWALFVVPTSL